jgi:hypothetical protein
MLQAPNSGRRSPPPPALAGSMQQSPRNALQSPKRNGLQSPRNSQQSPGHAPTVGTILQVSFDAAVSAAASACLLTHRLSSFTLGVLKGGCGES